MGKKVFGLLFAALFMISTFAAIPASAETVEWSEPVIIGESGQEWPSPALAANGQGLQIVAWIAMDESDLTVYANRFEPETGWLGAETIGTSYYNWYIAIDVGIDEAGNSIVVWTADAMVLSRTYVPDNGEWSELTVVSDSGQKPHFLQISVCANGGAAAAWMDWGDDSQLGVYVSLRNPDSSWGAVELIRKNVYYPSIAMDDNMNAICAYRMSDGVQYNFYAVRYVNGQGWGSEILIGNNIWTWDYPSKPTMAMNGNGLAIAVWHSLQDSHPVAFANVLNPESGTWEGEIPIEDSAAGSSTLADVDVDENGEAVAAWRLAAPVGTPTDVRANRYNQVSGWSGPTTIGEVVGPIGGVPIDIKVCAMAGVGAYVAWTDDTWFYPSSWNLYANHYSPSDGWGETSVIAETMNISRIDIDANHLGGATLAWAATYDWHQWSVYTSGCSGTVSGSPVAVMDVQEKSNNWKTWRFDGRGSTDDGRIVEYLWDFGDGSTADKVVTWHTYKKAGDYTVTLTVWDNDGISDAVTITLPVRPSA